MPVLPEMTDSSPAEKDRLTFLRTNRSSSGSSASTGHATVALSKATSGPSDTVFISGPSRYVWIRRVETRVSSALARNSGRDESEIPNS